MPTVRGSLDVTQRSIESGNSGMSGCVDRMSYMVYVLCKDLRLDLVLFGTSYSYW